MPEDLDTHRHAQPDGDAVPPFGIVHAHDLRQRPAFLGKVVQVLVQVPHGPDGTLWVGMMNTTYAKAVDNAICKKPQEGDGVLNTLRTALPLPWNGNTSSTGPNSTGTSAGGSTTKAKGS